jgi:AcrB/AcrD/AcrF family
LPLLGFGFLADKRIEHTVLVSIALASASVCWGIRIHRQRRILVLFGAALFLMLAGRGFTEGSAEATLVVSWRGAIRLWPPGESLSVQKVSAVPRLASTLRDQGMERHEALVTSSHARLRPILMTTISIIAGMLPIAFGRGAGAGSRATMAVTIIGGQMLCLLLTLLVTPVVFSYFDDVREWSPSKILAWLRRRATQPGTASF